MSKNIRPRLIIGKVVGKKQYVQLWKTQAVQEENLSVKVAYSHEYTKLIEALKNLVGRSYYDLYCQITSLRPIQKKYQNRSVEFGYPLHDKERGKIYYDPHYIPWKLKPLQSAYRSLDKAESLITQYLLLDKDKRKRCLTCGKLLQVTKSKHSKRRQFCPAKCQMAWKTKLKRWRRYTSGDKKRRFLNVKATRKFRRQYPAGRKSSRETSSADSPMTN